MGNTKIRIIKLKFEADQTRKGTFMVSRIIFKSERDNWKTPRKFYEELNKEFNFNFDPCPPNPEFDGLNIEWKKRNFINPPFSKVSEWIEKGYKESLKKKLCVFLVASRTDTRWFHNFVLPYAKEIRFIKGRLKFDEHKNSAPFPSCIIIFDNR